MGRYPCRQKCLKWERPWSSFSLFFNSSTSEGLPSPEDPIGKLKKKMWKLQSDRYSPTRILSDPAIQYDFPVRLVFFIKNHFFIFCRLVSDGFVVLMFGIFVRVTGLYRIGVWWILIKPAVCWQAGLIKLITIPVLVYAWPFFSLLYRIFRNFAGLCVPKCFLELFSCKSLMVYLHSRMLTFYLKFLCTWL